MISQNKECPNCLALTDCVKNGKSKDGRQTYLCRKCERRFVINRIKTRKKTKRAFYKLNEYESFKKIVIENDMLVPPHKELMSKLGVTRQTLIRWEKHLDNQHHEPFKKINSSLHRNLAKVKKYLLPK